MQTSSKASAEWEQIETILSDSPEALEAFRLQMALLSGRRISKEEEFVELVRKALGEPTGYEELDVEVAVWKGVLKGLCIYASERGISIHVPRELKCKGALKRSQLFFKKIGIEEVSWEGLVGELCKEDGTEENSVPA